MFYTEWNWSERELSVWDTVKRKQSVHTTHNGNGNVKQTANVDCIYAGLFQMHDSPGLDPQYQESLRQNNTDPRSLWIYSHKVAYYYYDYYMQLSLEFGFVDLVKRALTDNRPEFSVWNIPLYFRKCPHNPVSSKPSIFFSFFVIFFCPTDLCLLTITLHQLRPTTFPDKMAPQKATCLKLNSCWHRQKLGHSVLLHHVRMKPVVRTLDNQQHRRVSPTSDVANAWPEFDLKNQTGVHTQNAASWHFIKWKHGSSSCFSDPSVHQSNIPWSTE